MPEPQKGHQTRIGGFKVKLKGLVALYSALLRDYLSDIPHLAPWGFWLSQHEEIGGDTPPLACAPEVRYPHQRGVSRRYSHNATCKQGKKCKQGRKRAIPLFDIVSQRHCIRCSLMVGACGFLCLHFCGENVKLFVRESANPALVIVRW